VDLAQLNIARAKWSLHDPQMAEFVDNLERINGLAEKSPGYIWRLQDDSGDATSIKLFDDPQIIVNMSVWESVDALKNFIFNTHHVDFLKRRYDWFEKMQQASHVMWWVESGHQPSTEEAVNRLEHLRDHGDTPTAFGFRATDFHAAPNTCG
jgi:hypothetical protein